MKTYNFSPSPFFSSCLPLVCLHYLQFSANDWPFIFEGIGVYLLAFWAMDFTVYLLQYTAVQLTGLPVLCVDFHCSSRLFGLFISHFCNSAGLFQLSASTYIFVRKCHSSVLWYIFENVNTVSIHNDNNIWNSILCENTILFFFKTG